MEPKQYEKEIHPETGLLTNTAGRVPGSLRESVAGFLAFRPKHCWCQWEKEFSLEQSPVRLGVDPGVMALEPGFSAFLSFYKQCHLSVQSLSHVQLFATSWTAACQASLSFTNSQSLLKLMSTASVIWTISWSIAIQPSRPLSSPSPLAFNLSQHPGLFK